MQKREGSVARYHLRNIVDATTHFPGDFLNGAELVPLLIPFLLAPVACVIGVSGAGFIHHGLVVSSRISAVPISDSDFRLGMGIALGIMGLSLLAAIGFSAANGRANRREDSNYDISINPYPLRRQAR